VENKSKEEINMSKFFILVAGIGIVLQIVFVSWTLIDIRDELRMIRKHLRGEKIEEN